MPPDETTSHGHGLVQIRRPLPANLQLTALQPSEPRPGDESQVSRHSVGAGLLVQAVRRGQPFPGAEQVIEVGDQVGQVGGVGAEV